MRILVTDYVWPSLEVEERILSEIGATLVVAPDGNEDTLVRLASGCDGILTCWAKTSRRVIEAALTTPTRVTQLPSQPNGAHVVADFMGQFFHGQTGYNLAYRAAINREDCRGLDGSDAPPAPLPARGGGR